jgi:hypothetical protein
MLTGAAAVALLCVLRLSCRETTEVTDIGPYKVPEGIVVWPMIYALQNSMNNWEDPEDFNPVSHHTFRTLSFLESNMHATHDTSADDTSRGWLVHLQDLLA